MTSGAFRAPLESVEDPGEFWVFFGGRELPLSMTETLIGRGEGCHIVVNEPLVSRRHARLVLEGGHVFIEDLGSANGTFVNQARLHGRALLFPGDHVFIGTCEIELTRRDDSEDRPTIPALDIEDRHTPASGVAAFEPVSSSRDPSSSERRFSTRHPHETTTELDAFEYLGRLADKMFTLGRVDAAQKILEANLMEILVSARSGRTPSGQLVDAAARYATKLANETQDGKWVDFAVELHMLVVRPLREETIQAIAALRTRASLGDDSLIERYVERLRANSDEMNTAERILCERVACLLPALGADNS